VTSYNTATSLYDTSCLAAAHKTVDATNHTMIKFFQKLTVPVDDYYVEEFLWQADKFHWLNEAGHYVKLTRDGMKYYDTTTNLDYESTTVDPDDNGYINFWFSGGPPDTEVEPQWDPAPLDTGNLPHELSVSYKMYMYRYDPEWDDKVEEISDPFFKTDNAEWSSSDGKYTVVVEDTCTIRGVPSAVFNLYFYNPDDQDDTRWLGIARLDNTNQLRFFEKLSVLSDNNTYIWASGYKGWYNTKHGAYVTLESNGEWTYKKKYDVNEPDTRGGKVDKVASQGANVDEHGNVDLGYFSGSVRRRRRLQPLLADLLWKINEDRRRRGLQPLAA